MSSSESMVCFACCIISCGLGFFYDFRYFSRRLKALSDRVDKLVLQIEQLETERDNFEK